MATNVRKKFHGLLRLGGHIMMTTVIGVNVLATSKAIKYRNTDAVFIAALGNKRG